MTIYYIDPTGSNGSGTEESPFNTWASVTWAAGNSYLQKRGTTFTGTINVSTGGSSENARVYLGSYGSGAIPAVNANGGQFGIFVTGSQSFVTVDGFEVYGCNNASAIAIYKATGVGTDVTFINNNVHDIIGTSAAGLKMFCDRGRYLYNTVRRVSADGIFVEGDDAEVAYNDVDFIDLDNNLGDCVQVADTTISSHNPWVHHNKLRHTQTSSKQAVILQTTASAGGVVEYNECAGANAVTHKTILILQPNVQVRWNYVTGGVWGIGLQGTNCHAYGNVVIQTYSDGIGILLDQANCSARQNTVLYKGGSPSTVPGISHFNVLYTGCSIVNNISRGFAYGIRRDTTACSDSYNNPYGVIANVVNAGLSPVTPGTGSVIGNPELGGDFMPASIAVRKGGTFLRLNDYYGKRFHSLPTIGAVQYQQKLTTTNRIAKTA
jgi:hypothetical protein